MAYTNWGRGGKKVGMYFFCLFVVIVRGQPTLNRYLKTIVSCTVYYYRKHRSYVFFSIIHESYCCMICLYSPYLVAYLQSIRCYTASHEILLAAHFSPYSLQSPLPHHMEPCCTLFSTCCLQSPLPRHMKLGRSMCRGKMRDTHAWMYVYRAQWRKWTTLSAESSFSR